MKIFQNFISIIFNEFLFLFLKKNQNIGNFKKNNAWKNYPNILGKIYEYFFTVN